MIVAMWKPIPGFKIRKKADVQTFVEKVLVKGSYYSPVIFNNSMLWHIDTRNDSLVIDVKAGDLRNPFYPEVRYEGEDAFELIWKNRALVNSYFFG